MQPYKLRPHHGLCFSFFCGHGYSADFTEHMTKTLLHFQQHNPQILLTVGADCICAACPHCCHDCCSAAEQVERYDRAVLNSCGLREGDVLDWNVFRQQVQEQSIQKSFRISAERVLGIPFAAGKMPLPSVRHFYKNRFSLKFTIRSKKKRKASFILLSVFLLSC